MGSKKYILRIVGINHDDPAMRQGLIELLSRFRVNYGTPDFVAVEWDEDVFNVVRAERKEFRVLLKQHWPGISENLLTTLVLSLGYEGDSHREVYPNVRILWLDQGRQYLPGFKDNCAKWKLSLYKGFLKDWDIEAREADTLLRMSQRASNVTTPDYSDRDKKFAGMIQDETAKDGNRWAIIVVGNDHALKRNGSMRNLLEGSSYVCEVVSFPKSEAKKGPSPLLLGTRAARVLGGRRTRTTNLAKALRK